MQRLETPAIAAPESFTALGFALAHKLPHDKRSLQAFGTCASPLTRESGASVRLIHDARYGHIGTYSEEILEQAAKELGLIAA